MSDDFSPRQRILFAVFGFLFFISYKKKKPLKIVVTRREVQKAEICFCLSRHKRDVEEKDLKLKMIASNKSNFLCQNFFLSP